MCGRYTVTVRPEQVAERFDVSGPAPGFRPRYNLAPTQPAPVVVMESGSRALQLVPWGLIPHWVEEVGMGTRLINARMETLTTKPSFRPLVQQQRCLVAADGFFEWRSNSAQREAFRFTLADEGLMAFAGLWDVWVAPDGKAHKTFTIITVAANELMLPLHSRMPAILPRAQESAWLEGAVPDALAALQPYPSGSMRCYPVSDVVNSVKRDTAACIAPKAVEKLLL